MVRPLQVGDKVLYDEAWVEVWTISLDDGTQLSNLRWIDSSDLQRMGGCRWLYVDASMQTMEVTSE